MKERKNGKCRKKINIKERKYKHKELQTQKN